MRSLNEFYSDAMSTSGGPIVVRDRVDYSVTRGGLRVWIALVVFVLLMGGLVSLLTESELSELAKAVGKRNSKFTGQFDFQCSSFAKKYLF